MNNEILLLAITVFCLYVIANMLTFGVLLGLGYVVATVIIIYEVGAMHLPHFYYTKLEFYRYA